MYEAISFLTDYGLEDGFVAACHGVVATVCPHARIIDVTHLVPPGDVRRGATLLAQVVPYLPVAVHVGIVDPGVGSARRGLAVVAPGGAFVGPDNGLLLWAADRAGGVRRAFELTNRRLMRDPVSRTFHGRDVFAPVAAHLAAGVPVEEVGPALEVESLVRLRQPVNRVVDGRLESEILSVDRFGNLQLAASAADLGRIGSRPGDRLVLRSGHSELPVCAGETFVDVAPGEPLVYVDSDGLLAVAVNLGRAADLLDLGAGAVVALRAAAAEDQ